MSDLDDWDVVPEPIPEDSRLIDLYAERSGRLLLVPRGQTTACIVPEPTPLGAFVRDAEFLAHHGVEAWSGETIDLDDTNGPLELAAGWEDGEVLNVMGIGPTGEEAGEPSWRALRYLGPDRA